MRPRRRVSPLPLVLVLMLVLPWAGCSTLSPEQAASASAFSIEAGAPADFPGARTVVDGIDFVGERSLRDGDELLFGVEIARGAAVTRNLLRVTVRRHRPGFDLGTLRYHKDDGSFERRRSMRALDLELTLFAADGQELQRSTCKQVPDYFLEASFLDGIAAARRGQQDGEQMATARLVAVVNLLNDDHLLRRLLRAAAAVPFDLRLLFRRELTMTADFVGARQVAAEAALPAWGAALGERQELPFDLYLNGSLFVRLVATVVAPRGPLGAVAGIVALRAQQADDPERQVRLLLLGARRGPRDEWQQRAVLAIPGWRDEGVALAFSPDGRFVATPGDAAVELREPAVAPMSPTRLLHGGGPVGALAFLDADTLLVGNGAQVALYEVGGAAPGSVIAAAATFGLDRELCGLEVVGGGVVFVLTVGAGIERWTFAGGRREAVEVVRAAAPTKGRLDSGEEVEFYGRPGIGAMVAAEAERVVLAWHGAEREWCRDAAGAWQAQVLPPLPAVTSRQQRLRRPEALPGDALAPGLDLLKSPDSRWSAFTGRTVTVLGPKVEVLGVGYDPGDAFVHGFDTTSRWYAFVAPGYRLLVDLTRL
ncbi:MAG: hypothetical protein IT455_14510 [Planctomycetes bacterium]|nr:hypothetical protein [Planctomycetota bacterium]